MNCADIKQNIFLHHFKKETWLNKLGNAFGSWLSETARLKVTTDWILQWANY